MGAWPYFQLPTVTFYLILWGPSWLSGRRKRRPIFTAADERRFFTPNVINERAASYRATQLFARCTKTC